MGSVPSVRRRPALIGCCILHVLGMSRNHAFGDRDSLSIVKIPTNRSLSFELFSALLLACVNGKWPVFGHTDCTNPKDEGGTPLFILSLMASCASAKRFLADRRDCCRRSASAKPLNAAGDTPAVHARKVLSSGMRVL